MDRSSENPDHLEIPLATRSGSIGCASILLFIAAGILTAVVLILVGVIEIDESRWVGLVYLPFVLALLWVAKGVFTGLALQRVTIDRKSRTFTERYGSGTGRTREVVRNFDELAAVVLSSHTSHSRKGGSTRYFDAEVRFTAPESGKPGVTRLGSFSEDYFKARELAERVAKLCRLPLEDSAMGEKTAVRAPEDLDVSLREKGRRTWHARPSVERPRDARTVIRDRGDRIEIEFPPYKLQLGCFVSLAFVGVWIAFGLNAFLPLLAPSGGRAQGVGAFEFYLGLLVVAVPTLLALFFLVLAKGRRQRLIIRPDTVEHEMYRVLPRKRIVMPRDSIEEIIMGRGTLMDQGPFIIRGDQGQITVGNTVMSKAEREYLRNFIENELSK